MMTSNERWQELKKKVDQYEAAEHVGPIRNNYKSDRSFHDGFNTALNWVMKQIEGLEEK